jgi:hypothetical protein
LKGFAALLIIATNNRAMLAASTVGPGTIIVMAKAGTDHNLRLCWCVIVASIVAFIQQEAAARLYIVSGLNLGSAMRFHFNRHGSTPVISTMLAAGIFVGNIALECAQFVGLLASVDVVYEPDNNEARIAFSICMSAVAGAVVSVLLMFGNVDAICQVQISCMLYHWHWRFAAHITPHAFAGAWNCSAPDGGHIWCCHSVSCCCCFFVFVFVSVFPSFGITLEEE